MGYNQKSDLTETLYISKRRIKAFLHGLAYYACRIFPVDKKKIVMWTFEGGGGYGCSSKTEGQLLIAVVVDPIL